jgi:hypothetical protein
MTHSDYQTIPIVNPQGTDNEMLESLQRETFDYFLKEVNPKTGLVADKNQPGSASSIAVVGMCLTALIVGIERKYISRKAAIDRILKILRFFWNSPQGPEPDSTGYKGFYYHFLDMDSGTRACNCELSTIDTTFLLAGALTVATYFKGNGKAEREIRQLTDDLYRRVDWVWALNGGTTISHGWKPESGFLPFRWDTDYNEAILLYLLALGSPTYPVHEEGYRNWTSGFTLKKLYEIEHLYAGPLFIHQFSHMWVDFRGITDEFNRKAGFDYFENSRRATLVHRLYAIENPQKFDHYGPFVWGLTASDGPGNSVLDIRGTQRIFFDYVARGAPFGPDDGTVSPWAVVASLPFAPEIVIDTIRHAIERLNLKRHRLYGFDSSFNPTYPEKQAVPTGWVSPWRFGLNQGPTVIMIENYQSELIWKIMQQCPYMIKGLRKAGFSNGWLNGNPF